MSLLVAVLVAGVLAIPGTAYRTYEAWWTWSKPQAAVGLLIYLAAAGGGGGLLGWVVGRFSGAAADQELWLRGIFYGVAGAAALRASMRVKPKLSSSPRANPVGDSALGATLSWIGDMLDTSARSGAQRWFSGLRTGDLLYQSHNIKVLILQQPISDAAKKKLMTQFVEAVELLRSNEADRRDEGHAHLVTLSARYAVDERISKRWFASTGRANPAEK